MSSTDLLDRIGYSSAVFYFLVVDLSVVGMMGLGLYTLHDAYLDQPKKRRKAFQKAIVNVGTKGLAFATGVGGVMWLFGYRHQH